MAIATLSVDLVAKLASFERDMGKAARASEKTANQIAGAFGLIKSAAVGLAAGIGVGGLIALTRGAIDSLDALNDLKDATGASIENISALEDVAKRTGTSLDTVSAVLVKFNMALGDAKPDSNIALALESIGLNVTELRRLDPAEALRQTAVALSQYADDGDKARLVQELFGKSVREAAPFLKDLAEQGKLVATVTTEQAEEAEKFNKQLFAMQANLLGVSRALIGPVLTGMNGLIDKFKQGSEAGEGFIVTLLRQTEIARLLGLANAKAANTGGASGSFASAGGGRGAVNPEFVRPSVTFNADGVGGKPKTGRRGSARSQSEELTDAQRALASYVEGLSRAVERTQDLTEVEKALNFLRFQGAAGQVPQVRELVLGLAQQIDAEKILTEAQRQRMEQGRQFAIEERARVERENAALAERTERLLAPTATVQLAQAREDMIFLTELFEKGRIGETQYLEAVTARLGMTNERIEKTKTLAEELGLTFTSAFEDAIVGGKKFSDVIKGLEQDILRIVTRKAVTEPLGNFVSGLFSSGGSAGGIGDWFSKLLSFEGGGFTGSGPRSGGMDGRGGFMAMVHPRETVIDHTKGQRLGASVAVNIVQNFAPGTSRATTLQAAADASRQLQLAARNL